MSRRYTWQWFRDIPIAQKLYFTVGIMATLIAVELLTLWFAIGTLSSVRAYVGGEGLWSKGQKDAVYHLQKYGQSHDDIDYQSYALFLNVPMGDHKARLAMIKPEPDMAMARQGFLEGRNHPDDIDGMIHLMLRFHAEQHIHQAIEAWSAADDRLMQIPPVAEQLHREISHGHPDQHIIDSLQSRIQTINEQVTVQEDRFSFALGEGSRWLENIVLKLLFGVALTVEISGLLLAFSVSRSIQRGLQEIIRVSKAIALGDFTQKATVFSQDEIGTLALSINNMADELSKAENKFRKLLESAPDAMVIVNRNGVIRLVNAQTEKMFQYTREEMIGQSVEILIPGDFAKHHSAHRDGYFKDPKVRTMGIGLELYGKRKNGEEFPVEISLSPLETEEGMWVSSAIRDITDKKHDHEALRDYARKLEVTNNNLEQFAYVASHDLQEPLRTITSYVSLLEEEQKGHLNQDSVKYMEFVVTAADRMKVLIKDLLMFSRVGKKHLIEKIDCNEIIYHVMADIDSIVTETHAKVTSGHLPMLRASRIEIHQLFLNLVTNAIKYSKPGVPPEIRIEAVRLNGNWQFSVADNGIGIDKEYFERIFIIFQRLHNQDQYSGTGIGLATCKKIVELNGGTIWVESEPGRGSTFYFTFPALFSSPDTNS